MGKKLKDWFKKPVQAIQEDQSELAPYKVEPEINQPAPCPVEHRPSITEVMSVRKHSDRPVRIPWSCKLENIPVSDDQTLIIQYDNMTDTGILKSYIRSLAKLPKSAESFISPWLSIDVYVDINGSFKSKKPWLRIVYECLEDNPLPHPHNDRFPGATIVHVYHGIADNSMPLDMLIEGGR